MGCFSVIIQKNKVIRLIDSNILVWSIPGLDQELYSNYSPFGSNDGTLSLQLVCIMHAVHVASLKWDDNGCCQL